MTKGTVYLAGALRLDLADERVFLNGVALSLGHKSFALLVALVQSPQRLLTKDELIETVWDGRAVSDGVLTTAMRELRSALNDKARDPQFIQTVHGRGYRFLLEVEMEGDLEGETENPEIVQSRPPETPAKRQTTARAPGL